MHSARRAGRSVRSIPIARLSRGPSMPRPMAGKSRPPGDGVDRRELLGQQHGVARWGDDHAGAQLEALGARGHGGEGGQRSGVAERGGVAQPERVVAELLHRLDGLPEPRRARVDRLERVPSEPDADAHGPPPMIGSAERSGQRACTATTEPSTRSPPRTWTKVSVSPRTTIARPAVSAGWDALRIVAVDGPRARFPRSGPRPGARCRAGPCRARSPTRRRWWGAAGRRSRRPPRGTGSGRR